MTETLVLQQTVQNLRGTAEFAKNAVKHFAAGETILLYGDLGSGKTHLVREFVRLLGLKAEVSSPSFSLINRYEGIICVNHIDLYRISDEYELRNLGLDDLWGNPDISFIEWPQLIEKMIRWPHFKLSIKTLVKNLKWREFSLFKIYG
jgi:tRNA threonylcarbamoyladenosine biosynthesis protein TsaE